jgi:hypothetical protein
LECEVNILGLPCAEGDDAAHRIVGRDTDGDSIPGNYLDTKAAHPAAQLRQHFVPGITLHSIQPAGVDRDDGALHIYQIVFAQQIILSPIAAISVPQFALKIRAKVKGQMAKVLTGLRP